MNYSQAKQDEFIQAVLHGKKNGWWLELGGNDPVQISNTYALETRFGWRGITVEMDKKWLPKYQAQRPGMFPVISDARLVDYVDKMSEVGMPEEIDYLQIDLEPSNRSTLTCLEILDRLVMDDHHFNVVTFEHDIYSGNHYNTRLASREIFASRGYIRLFSNVLCNATRFPFEDWYVHPSVMCEADVRAIKNDPRYVLENIFPNVCVDLVRSHHVAASTASVGA